ncbi:MAG: S53 family peptidase [Terracidiphilus sp.]|jgi:subtilase family serine protease
MQIQFFSSYDLFLHSAASGVVTATKAAVVAFVLAAALTSVQAQESLLKSEATSTVLAKQPANRPGTLLIPASNQIKATDKGKRSHTNLRLIAPSSESPLEAPPFSGYAYETPASLACIYKTVTPVPGCNPNTVTRTPEGGSETIAIVDAYDDPGAYGDLAAFSSQFGLPLSAEKFQVVYAGGTQPDVDSTGGWEIEESLDIEYAHAMAPNAMLYLVEANSNLNGDLFSAVQVATNLVVCGQTEIATDGSGTIGKCPWRSKGRGEVSMSWGGDEFSNEAAYDTYFDNANVVYFASAGDSAGVIYPSTSPYVVAVGGTTTARSQVSGDLIREIAWSDGGGGLSAYESIPSYQSSRASVAAVAGMYRAVPDLSSDANPYTGVWIYDSFPIDGVLSPYNWYTVGGTSVSAPTIAGIINAAATYSGDFANSSTAELTALYKNLDTPSSYAKNFNDITYGYCGFYSGLESETGYDLCTGLGSSKGLAGK